MKPPTHHLGAAQPLKPEGNISLVVERLAIDGPLSRAALAQRVGLAKPTISRLVQDLLDASYVRETGIVHVEKGRPAILLKINPDLGYILAAEIGVDFLSAVLANFATEIIWRHEESILPGSSLAEVLDRVVAAVNVACNQRSQLGSPILGLMVGITGLIEQTTGKLLLPASPGWEQLPVQSLLSRQFDFPVFVENKARLAALSESYFGAARNASDVLYLDLGANLGAGYMLNRRAFTGATGAAGQVGHMVVDPEGPACVCGGRGCWEIFTNQQAVLERVRRAVKNQPSCLREAALGSPEKFILPMVIEAARNGDSVALAAFEETGRYLGLGLVNLIHLLNPGMIVLGGVLSSAHEFFMPVVRVVLQERALRWLREAAQIVIAAQGSDACLMGGVVAIHRQVVSRRSREAPRAVLPVLPEEGGEGMPIG